MQPADDIAKEGRKNPYWLKTATGSSRDLLDTQIQRNLKERYIKENAKKFDADFEYPEHFYLALYAHKVLFS